MAKPTKLKENGIYELIEDTTICITARDKVNLYITEDENGVSIRMYPVDEDSDTPLADTYLSYHDEALKGEKDDAVQTD